MVKQTKACYFLDVAASYKCIFLKNEKACAGCMFTWIFFYSSMFSRGQTQKRKHNINPLSAPHPLSSSRLGRSSITINARHYSNYRATTVTFSQSSSSALIAPPSWSTLYLAAYRILVNELPHSSSSQSSQPSNHPMFPSPAVLAHHTHGGKRATVL